MPRIVGEVHATDLSDVKPHRLVTHCYTEFPACIRRVPYTAYLWLHDLLTLRMPRTMNTQITSVSQSQLSGPATAALGSPTEIDIDVLRQHVPVLRRKLSAGQYVYRAGQPFQSLFLVHVGFLKTCELADDGREQVTGFRMRGDLIGVESIGLATYSCDVVALEDSEVWELPYPPVLTACLEMPELQMRLTAALAEEIRRDRLWMLALGTLTAEQRVAAFLLDVASRYARLGFSDRHFILRMGRADMANFLALKHETVSRALSRLQDMQCICVQRREIRVLDVDCLHALAARSALN
jgi:CRP/FNR family transcriptional regulator, anaerobic regulatory protein